MHSPFGRVGNAWSTMRKDMVALNSRANSRQTVLGCASGNWTL